MPAHRSTPSGRPHVLAVRLSPQEQAYVDKYRGSLSASAFMRLLILKDRKAREIG